MKISTKGRYALRMMLDLAQQDQSVYSPLKDICKRQHVSMKYLEQITSMLNRCGFLRSNRGPKGGYTLSRKPSEYNIGEIIKATEGEIYPVDCLCDKDFCNKNLTECISQKFWLGLKNNIDDYLSKITLQDVLDGNV